MQSVTDFINQFLTPPPGSSPDAIRAKLLHWIERANNPEQFSADQSKPALADLRRKARQNVRRLAARHPEAAKQIMRERSQGAA